MTPLRELMVILGVFGIAFAAMFQVMERYTIPDQWGMALVIGWSVSFLAAILWHGNRKRPADTQE